MAPAGVLTPGWPFAEKKVNTDNIPETSQVTSLENITRNDVTSPSLSQDEAISNTSNQQNGFFKVKAILEL